MELYDIIVVGGGPAGSTAARILADNGLDICQITKDVGGKDCAGILTPQHVKRYGIDESYVERELDGIMISNGNHDIRLDSKGDYSVDRRKFDLHLFSLVDHKSQKMEEVKDIRIDKDHVCIKTNKNNYHSRAVIAADGADSVVVKRLNLSQNGMAECAQGMAKCKSSDYFHIFLNYVKNGYGWISPKRDHCLVGIGSATQQVNLPEFASKIGVGISNISYSRVPFYGPIKKTYSDRLSVIGDAAGFATPFEGEGLYYACRSAELAVETILDCEEFSDNSLSTYEKRWKSEFGSTFSIFRFLTPFINNRVFMDFVLRISKGGLGNKLIASIVNKDGNY